MVDAMCCVPLFQFPAVLAARLSCSFPSALAFYLPFVTRPLFEHDSQVPCAIFTIANDLMCVDIYIRPGGLGYNCFSSPPASLSTLPPLVLLLLLFIMCTRIYDSERAGYCLEDICYSSETAKCGKM